MAYFDLVSILNFELVVCNACPKQHGLAAPSQKLLLSKAVFEAVLQYSHRKIQEKGCFLIKRTSQQLTVLIYVPPENGLVGLFTKKNLGEVSLLLRTRKFVEEMKITPQNTKKQRPSEVFENAISQI